MGSGQPEPSDSHGDLKALSSQGPAKELHLHSGHPASSREAPACAGKQCGEFKASKSVAHTLLTLHANSTGLQKLLSFHGQKSAAFSF